MARETQDHSVSRQSPLPEFEAPPLFETVFGVRFPRLRHWDVPHFGLYWERIREEYPEFEVKSPLAEPGQSKAKALGERVSLQLATFPQFRCWFLASGRNRLLQLQHDGFFHSWRKVTQDEVYPRYMPVIRPAFAHEWQRFTHFLADEGIGRPHVVECEATYVNHFEKDREWSSFADLGNVVRWWASGRTTDVLPGPDSVQISARIAVGEDVLNVALTPIIRRHDELEVLQLTLSVKGAPASSEIADVMAWMDDARETIVRGFTDLTTERMHKLWKRKS